MLRVEGARSMMSGDKTASVMTSWTTKVLNSRRRRRQFLEFRSSASAARRPTPAAPRNVMAVLVMLQKLNAILRNGRILLTRHHKSETREFPTPFSTPNTEIQCAGRTRVLRACATFAPFRSARLTPRAARAPVRQHRNTHTHTALYIHTHTQRHK